MFLENFFFVCGKIRAQLHGQQQQQQQQHNRTLEICRQQSSASERKRARARTSNEAKMQKGIRFNEGQLLYLAGKAKHENSICGNLYKKSSDTGKWQLRYFILYQNLLFYYENDSSIRPSGVALLEGSYCDRIITPATGHKGKESEKLVSTFFKIYLNCFQR